MTETIYLHRKDGSLLTALEVENVELYDQDLEFICRFAPYNHQSIYRAGGFDTKGDKVAVYLE